MYTPYNPNRDSTASPTLDALKGSPFSTQKQAWERAYVHDVNSRTYTCDVFTEKGKFLSGVPWPNNSGSIYAPKRGDKMAVSYDLGTPVLIPVTNATQGTASGNTPDARPPIPLTPVADVGGNDAVSSPNNSETINTARGSNPDDVISGDWVQSGTLGNAIGVLEGGATIMRAGDLAQIIATQAKNMLTLVGQNFKLYTGAGALEFITEDGKTSMTLRAGADHDTEASPEAENFRIRCELGHEGELVDFRVTDGKGRALYRMHIDPDGRVESLSAQTHDRVEGDSFSTVVGNRGILTEGSTENIVDGESVTSIGGSANTQSGGTYRVTSGRDISFGALHDVMINAARRMAVGASGEVRGSDPSMLFTAANGDVHFNIGDPRAGDAQVRKSGFRVDTVTGEIEMTTMVGTVSLNSARPGGVKIGGAAGVGPFSAVLYEMLSAFMEVFGVMIDTHVHLFPAAPPPLGMPTSPPVIPPWRTTSWALSSAKSNFVKIGG